MTDSTGARWGGAAPAPPGITTSPSEMRAERRRIIESIRALRSLLKKRRLFELTEQQRLIREAADRNRAQASHLKTLRRIEQGRADREASLNRQLWDLDGRREQQEQQALAVLRRESIQRTLRGAHLTVPELNGFGTGLLRDLAAQGIKTADDFTGMSRGIAPNGKGGEVLYIHRTAGGRVHINGIGEHRGRTLMEWRASVVTRAENRAPRVLPPEKRHKIAEIIDAERKRLQRELAEVPRSAATARAQAERVHMDAWARIDAAHQQAWNRAAERRAEFDAMAEKLLDLQAELAAHIDRFGDVGRRVRRAQRRALRPVPEAPARSAPGPHGSPYARPRSTGGAPSHPKAADPTGPTLRKVQPQPTTGKRASLGWLLPIVFFALTGIAGTGEVDPASPVWLLVGIRLVAFAMTAELLRLWIPRRRRGAAGSLPPGTGLMATATFFALLGASMFADPEPDGGAGWAALVLSLILLLGGVARRTRKKEAVTASA